MSLSRLLVVVVVVVALLFCGTCVCVDAVCSVETKIVDAAANDGFGTSVAVSGATIVVGVPYTTTSDRGVALVYKELSTGAHDWTAMFTLVGSDTYNGDEFGMSVAIDTDIVCVRAHKDDVNSGSTSHSAAGAVFIFREQNFGADDWEEVAKIFATDIQGTSYFGYSVAVDGNTVAAGAYRDTDVAYGSGAVYMFRELSPGVFTEITKCIHDDAANYDYFGWSVDISGSIMVDGAYRDSPNYHSGAAIVFREVSTNSFQQVFKLRPTEALSNYAYFGWSVAIDGRTIVVGAYKSDNGAYNVGSAFVFYESSQDVWDEIIELVPTDPAENSAYDYCGYSVDISGPNILVGCYEDFGGNQGSVFHYHESSVGQNDWTDVARLTASDMANNDYFGWDCAIDGSRVVIGAAAEDGAGTDSGSAYVIDELCGASVDLCASSPCLNDGVCQLVGENAVCNCTTGAYTGALCESDVDDCASSPCLAGSLCDDLGANVFNCTDMDDCASSPCAQGTSCVDMGAELYVCIDLDDCASSPCSSSAWCNDTGALSFECVDIDDCISSPCSASGVCVDRGADAFSCTCIGGTTGALCENSIDDCLSSPCFNGGECVDGAKEFSCLCAEDYTGTVCESSIDDCLSSPCFNGGECVDSVKNFSCVCTGDYTGTVCDSIRIDPCLSRPCANGGECENHSGEVFCNCNGTGYENSMCTDDIDDCASQPCLNGGTCTDTGANSIECSCTWNFVGKVCNTELVFEPTPTTLTVVFEFVSFTDTSNVTSLEQLEQELPVFLSQSMNGTNPGDFHVEVFDRNGAYEVTVMYTNPDNDDLFVLERIIAESEYINKNLRDVRVLSDIADETAAPFNAPARRPLMLLLLLIFNYM